MNALFRVITLLLVSIGTCFAHPGTIHITFISPNPDDQDFWGITHNFARASAKDLNIDLDIVYSATNRYAYLKNVRQACASIDKPDYLVAVFHRAIAEDILFIAEECQIPIFMVNAGIPKEDKATIGNIRENYKFFIGHMAPSEHFAGYLLGKQLIKSARDKSLSDTIEIVGISGRRDGPEALARNEGLKQAAREQNVLLHQIVFADWSGDKAGKQAAELIKRYPNVSIIWLLAITCQSM